jgi:hypothetical protein
LALLVCGALLQGNVFRAQVAPAAQRVGAEPAAGAALPSATAAPTRPESATGGAAERSRIVVGFRPGVARPQRAELLARLGAALRRDLGALRAAGATVPAADRDAILARLRAEPAVAFAEIDRRLNLVRPQLGARLPLASAAREPNDDGFIYQYSLRDGNDHDVDATDAWERRTKCAKVAVLDTGVDLDHKDLKKNLWRNDREVKGNGRDDDGNGYVDDDRGVDLVDGRGSGGDEHGHGTHAAGIVAAIGNNDRGVSGLCWKSQIIAVRFMDSEGRGYSSGAAEGIAYAVKHGAHVINASYGTDEPTDVERTAIRYAAEHDTLIVAAAGNDGENADKHPGYPAAYPDDNVISVAASDENDRLASFSNWGKKSVDLAAPGDRIASTWNDGSYRYLSGTSMATPLVAAAAAMLRKQGDGLPAARVRKLLLKHADDGKPLKGKVASGGRLNVRRSLNAVD